jgi:hypothetical protein
MPQGDATWVREDVPVWEHGSATIAVPVKVTPWAGPGAEDRRFRKLNWPAIIADGMERFAFRERIELGRSDRSWYADFHPYLAEDGTLYVSSELYSQFNCHVPVKSWLDDPIVGSMDDPLAAFRQAAARAEAEIVRLMAESDEGDGFDVVDERVVSWEDAGLALPARPAGDTAEVGDLVLPQRWVVDSAAQDEQPAVQFTWPPPVDAYSGEASAITGTLELGGDADPMWTFAGLSGSFVARAESVTMGEPDLDAYIHGGILEAGEHPQPRFVIERVEVDAAFADQAVTPGPIVPVTLHGSFTMKETSIPLTVPMSAEVVLGDDDRPRLVFTGRWSLRLDEPWNIEGPPGPKEASREMRFACRIVLEPAED